jgi:hypothetical protein
VPDHHRSCYGWGTRSTRICKQVRRNLGHEQNTCRMPRLRRFRLVGSCRCRPATRARRRRNPPIASAPAEDTPPTRQLGAPVDRELRFFDIYRPLHRMLLPDHSVIILNPATREVAMKSSWQTDTGSLACRWSEAEQQVRYNSAWMREASDIQGSYLPPLPDFASHSPFGGASWFELHCTGRKSE